MAWELQLTKGEAHCQTRKSRQHAIRHGCILPHALQSGQQLLLLKLLQGVLNPKNSHNSSDSEINHLQLWCILLHTLPVPSSLLSTALHLPAVAQACRLGTQFAGDFLQSNSVCHTQSALPSVGKGQSQQDGARWDSACLFQTCPGAIFPCQEVLGVLLHACQDGGLLHPIQMDPNAVLDIPYNTLLR